MDAIDYYAAEIEKLTDEVSSHSQEAHPVLTLYMIATAYILCTIFLSLFITLSATMHYNRRTAYSLKFEIACPNIAVGHVSYVILLES